MKPPYLRAINAGRSFIKQGLAVVWILTVLSGLVNAADSIQVVTSNFAPYNYIEDHEAKGICTWIVQALLKETGNDPGSISTLPWARAYQKTLKGKNTLIYTIARTSDREMLFHWVGILVTGHSYLFSLKNNPIRLRSLEQAEPYRIGVTRDDARTRFLQAWGMPRLDRVINSRMNAVKLLKHRIDLWAEDELAATHTIRLLGYDPGKTIAKALPLNFKLEGYLAFSRNTPLALVNKFRESLTRIKKTPQFMAVLREYTLPESGYSHRIDSDI